MTKSTTELDPLIAFFIRERVRKRQTQELIAQKTGINLSTYQRIEQGKRQPDLAEIRCLCQHHQLTWFDVALVEINKRPVAEPELIAATHFLSFKVRHSLLELIRTLTVKE